MSGSEVGRHRLNSVRNDQMVLGGCIHRLTPPTAFLPSAGAPAFVSAATPVGGGWESVLWCLLQLHFLRTLLYDNQVGSNETPSS